MSRWNVADVMTFGAVSVTEDTPFKAIVDVLEAHGVNAVPVVDPADRVVGVVSTRRSGCCVTTLRAGADTGVSGRSGR